MHKVALISCSKSKVDYKAKAEVLYSASVLFRKQLQFSKEILKADQIFIMSALHGCVELDQVLEPYKYTLIGKSDVVKRLWANNFVTRLQDKLWANMVDCEFYILGGKNYYEHIIPHLTYFKIPTKGLKMGETLSWYTKQLD